MNLPKRISYLLLLLFLACQPATKLETAVYPFPTIAPQSYLVFENFPSKNIPSRDIEVWLPKKYHSLDALPVLYMFDGQNIFHGTSGWSGEFNEGWQVDEVLDSLIEAKVIQDIMVVGIPNSPNRMSEYMPAKPSGLGTCSLSPVQLDFATAAENTTTNRRLGVSNHSRKPIVSHAVGT